MADLRALYESLGFENVTSYIQSGNVIFTAAEDNSETLATRIHDAINAEYGYDVPVSVYTLEEWQTIAVQNPFLGDNTDIKRLHVTLLADKPNADALNKVAEKDFSPDEWRIIGKAVYLHCPNGYGRSKLTNTFWEKALNTSATTRNWKTTLKLLTLAREL